MLNKIQLILFSLFFIFNFINRDISSIFLLATIGTCLYDYKNFKLQLTKNKYLVLLIILFTLWICVVGIYHNAPISELDNYFRLILLLPLLVIKMEDKVWRNILLYSAAGACVHLIYSYYNFDIPRYYGTSSHPITFANMIVTLILLILIYLHNNSLNKLSIFIVFIIVSLLFVSWVMTETRGPVIGFILSLLLILYWSRSKVIFFFTIVSMLTLFFFQNSLSERIIKLSDLEISLFDKTSIEKVLRSHSSKYVPLRERGGYFFYGFSTINKHPLLGIGPQNVEDGMREYLDDTGYLAVARDHLHNDFLDISVKFGTPALVLLLLIYLLLVYDGSSSRNKHAFIIFMVMLITSQLSQSHFAHHQAITFFISAMYVLRDTLKT